MSTSTEQPRLHVVTREPPETHKLTLIDPATFEDPEAPTPHPCDGTYRCSCPACDAERDHRVRQGVRRRKRQPWEAKAA